MTEFEERPKESTNTNSQVNLIQPHVESERVEEQFQLKAAGFWIRFWAYLIDLIVLIGVSGLIIKPAFRIAGWTISSPPFLLFSPYKVTMLFVFLLYFALMTKYMQQTVGKIIMGIKVVPKDDGQLTWGNVFFREIVGRFISKMLLIPYLLVIFMPKKEALHDLFADTYVVSENAYEKKFSSSYSREQLPERSTV